MNQKHLLLTPSVILLKISKIYLWKLEWIALNDVFKVFSILSILGYNCSIFAYGQTGAGKTFTMMGVNY
jgi:hypothetical protein